MIIATNAERFRLVVLGRNTSMRLPGELRNKRKSSMPRKERPVASEPCKVTQPFDFDGPFQDKDAYGANYYVEVRFLNREDANLWIEEQYRNMDKDIEVYEESLGGKKKKGLMARLGLA